MERLIKKKLSRLKEYVHYLRKLKDTQLKTFEADFKVRGAAERYLHLAIESVIDIGNEIISILQMRKPDQYKDIPIILAESGIIPKDFAAEIVKMIGFRNLLVHDYAIIDTASEYEFLETRLTDFEKYMKHVANWLKTKPFEHK